MLKDITAARRLLNEAGFVCVRVDKEASWAVGYFGELDADGFAIEASRDAYNDAADQVMAIKKHRRQKTNA